MAVTIVEPGSGRVIEGRDTTVTLKAESGMTGDRVGIYEIVLAARSLGAGLHRHHVMDKLFQVLEGRLTMMLGDGGAVVEAGGFAVVPRLTPHGFRNDGDAPVRFVLTFAPALQREGFFEGLAELSWQDHPDPAAYQDLMRRYDQEPLEDVSRWHRSG